MNDTIDRSAGALKASVVLLAALFLVSACASIPRSELMALGSKITPAKIDFQNLYAYAQRSKAAYGTAPAIRSQYPNTVRVTSPDNTDILYFLEQDDATRTQRVTVRGTANNMNWSEDLQIRIREDRELDIPVHSGFDKAARTLYTNMKPFLKPGYKTYVTGHSLGGAVAALLTLYMKEDRVLVERVVTFGQPRFTTTVGVERLSFLPLTRVVDENDIVPLVPPSSSVNPGTGPYDHVGVEIILLEEENYIYLDSHDADRISIGEFWRDLGVASVKDHHIDKYLRRLSTKTAGAVAVEYNNRQRYVARSVTTRAKPGS